MVKRGLASQRRFIHRKRAGTDSLKGREGLGRVGWAGGGVRKGAEECDRERPAGSVLSKLLAFSPNRTAASIDGLHEFPPKIYCSFNC